MLLKIIKINFFDLNYKLIILNIMKNQLINFNFNIKPNFYVINSLIINVISTNYLIVFKQFYKKIFICLLYFQRYQYL
jgi:hypothetical protein